MIAPTLDIAVRAAEQLSEDYTFGLIYPGDPRRRAIVELMAVAHKVAGSGWDREYALENVSVTLPGIGPAADLLKAIPVVGNELFSLASELEHPSIFLAPSIMRDGVTLTSVLWHELGHVGSIRAGGMWFCAAYGLFGEVRAGSEAPCYGVDIAIRHALEGGDVDAMGESAIDRLKNYGLGPSDIKLASGIIHSNVASIKTNSDPGGVVRDAKRALLNAGWKP